MIIQFDKRGIVTSTSRDAGTKEKKDKVWSLVYKAYNTANESNPVDLESLKVITKSKNYLVMIAKLNTQNKKIMYTILLGSYTTIYTVLPTGEHSHSHSRNLSHYFTSSIP